MCQKSQLAKLGLFDAKVPRYTSYPTAPNFGAEIDSRHFTSWVGEIPPRSQISLYLHIPFCRDLCWFCMCRTQGTRSDAPIATYVAALKREIALLKSHLPAGVTVSRLHLGGGTPTILTPEMIRDLTAALADLAPMAATGEFSVEIDPNAFDQPRCDALVAAGLTRASIGVQDFDPAVQQAIGRPLEFARTQQVIDMLRQGGVQNISTDLLFGLPYQTEDAIRKSTRQLLSCAPDRVALYGYIHLPAMIRRQAMIPSESLPTPQNRLKLFEAASSLLLQAGYRAIGIDHFAHPADGLSRAQQNRTLKRGFQGYSDDPADVLIGLGTSAISRFPQGYVQNAPSTARYMSAIDGGGFASLRGHAFQGEDTLRARMIEALLCDFHISRGEMLSRFPQMAAAFDTLVAAACAAYPDVLLPTPQGLTLTESGRPLARMIARHFDANETTPTRHSSVA
ncbi:oxygen-independent coproporphyrinogen III oxidase [Pseudophaeobacter sp.]|uniref:oxygen-independent coproporphyrinogen III oxidase n=1 Tax=Pseudophaeobacter sp. TaxID=1971739 RepID=UPI004058E4F8